jgi:hypothetical protein
MSPYHPLRAGDLFLNTTIGPPFCYARAVVYRELKSLERPQRSIHAVVWHTYKTWISYGANSKLFKSLHYLALMLLAPSAAAYLCLPVHHHPVSGLLRLSVRLQ